MSGQRVLITGGSKGIGAALVGRMRDAGHEVVFTGRDEERIARVAQKSGAYGLRSDISIDDDNARVVDICRERMGGIDILVNNAAFPYNVEIGDLAVDRMRELFATNVIWCGRLDQPCGADHEGPAIWGHREYRVDVRHEGKQDRDSLRR